MAHLFPFLLLLVLAFALVALQVPFCQAGATKNGASENEEFMKSAQNLVQQLGELHRQFEEEKAHFGEIEVAGQAKVDKIEDELIEREKAKFAGKEALARELFQICKISVPFDYCDERFLEKLKYIEEYKGAIKNNAERLKSLKELIAGHKEECQNARNTIVLTSAKHADAEIYPATKMRLRSQNKAAYTVQLLQLVKAQELWRMGQPLQFNEYKETPQWARFGLRALIPALAREFGQVEQEMAKMAASEQAMVATILAREQRLAELYQAVKELDSEFASVQEAEDNKKSELKKLGTLIRQVNVQKRKQVQNQ